MRLMCRRVETNLAVEETVQDGHDQTLKHTETQRLEI